MNSSNVFKIRCRFRRLWHITAMASLVIVASALVPFGSADGRIIPRPRPVPPAPPTGFLCDTNIEASKSVRAAFEEYYQCVEPEIGSWIEQHPNAVDGLDLLYGRWKEARRHDLRDRPEAARWSRQHAVDFDSPEVELTAEQIKELKPTTKSKAVGVPGILQRLFVDRSNSRLFLTTATEGLVSIDIAKRYDFSLEGRVGTSGATDFFIVDDKTAFVEETVAEGGNRDLVVLDISNRQEPREVARLRGVIPSVSGATSYDAGMAKLPPTFDQYLLYQEGRLATDKCGPPPTVSTHPGVHCRLDGTCYRREVLDEPNDGYCARIPPAQGRIAMGRIIRLSDGDFATAPTAVLEEMSVGTMATTSSRRTAMKPSPPVTPMPTSAPMPEGGAGGAGSLSQMMMYGNTLYVLSGSHGQAQGWLTTFDVTRPRRPTMAHVIRLDNGPEALQRHDNLLLIAGRDALVTASLGLSTSPRLLGEYRQECPVTFDPVVVQGSIAYRTIIVEQHNNACSSRLEVIELSQPHQPVLRATRGLVRPRGLAVLGERLFVADEHTGVTVFDLTDAVNPTPAGVLPLKDVADLVLSGFDLYALTPSQVETYWVGPLFEKGVVAKAAMKRMKGVTTVKRNDKSKVLDLVSSK